MNRMTTAVRSAILVGALVGVFSGVGIGNDNGHGNQIRAAELRIHRWVDADGVTHFSDTRPTQGQVFETHTLVTQAVTPIPIARRPRPERGIGTQSRSIRTGRGNDQGSNRAAAQRARCEAWLAEFRAITQQRRQAHTAIASARLRARSAELMYLRQQDC